jgi:replicative DNA helicase
VSEPIHDHAAEAALLGAVLSGTTDVDLLLEQVNADDFQQPRHEAIWHAVAEVHRSGQKPDAITVGNAARAMGARGVDSMLLFDLSQAAPVGAQAPHYAEMVISAAGRRALAAASVAIASIAATPGDLEEKREDARERLDAATRGRHLSKARRVADLLPSAIERAEVGQADVLATPWPDLDRSIGGLAPGRLIVIAASPGGGKSLAGTNLALHVAHHHGHAALIASLEMPEGEVMNRLIAAHCQASLTDLGNGTVTEKDWESIAAKKAELDAMPLYVDDTAAMSVQGLRRLARDVQREREDLALIVVDYLQLMKPASGRKDGNRAEEVSGIARDLKLLARETGACVVALTQVNRAGTKSETGPGMADLREAAIENDADQVIMLHRPDLEIPEVHVNVAKNRHGPLALTALAMRGHYAQLASVAWRPS